MFCTVAIFPNIIGVGSKLVVPIIYKRHTTDRLVIISSPTIPQSKGVTLRITRIVDMADCHRHQISAKAKVTSCPSKVSGIVIDIAGTCTPSGCGGIVPITFQTVSIAINNHQLRKLLRLILIVIDRKELFIIRRPRCFLFARYLQYYAMVCVRVPPPCSVCYIPRIADSLRGYVSIIFDHTIKIRLITPGDIFRCPLFSYRMRLNYC